MEELEENQTLSIGKQQALKYDFDLYWSLRKGEYHGDNSPEMKWLAEHAKVCGNYFMLNLAMKLHRYGYLTERQIAAMKRGCMKCGRKPNESP